MGFFSFFQTKKLILYLVHAWKRKMFAHMSECEFRACHFSKHVSFLPETRKYGWKYSILVCEVNLFWSSFDSITLNSNVWLNFYFSYILRHDCNMHSQLFHTSACIQWMLESCDRSSSDDSEIAKKKFDAELGLSRIFVKFYHEFYCYCCY